MSGTGGRPSGGTSVLGALRAAAATVHRDPFWWRKCLIHGALAITGVGLPMAAGFVLESYDNSRKGFPTPLPPWTDWTTRWLAGLFALLIDFAFFVLPLLIGGLLLMCVSVALLVFGITAQEQVAPVLQVIGALCGAFILLMFLGSVAPAGRLRFVRDGKPEEAVSTETIRWPLGPRARGAFARARLASLPAYLPAALVAGAIYMIGRTPFPGQGAALAACLWLLLSAITYAHLIACQIYIGAEREAL